MARGRGCWWESDMLPIGLETPRPPGMLHVMYIFQARARGVRPYAAPHCPLLLSFLPFPPFALMPGQWRGIDAREGEDSHHPSLYAADPPPLFPSRGRLWCVNGVGGRPQLQRLNQVVLGRSYLLNGVLGALWTPPHPWMMGWVGRF